MKDNKRILAALLAVMMAASSSAVVFADDVDKETSETTAVEAVAEIDPISANLAGEEEISKIEAAGEGDILTISSAKALATAIANQKANQTWNLAAGTYNLDQDCLDLYADWNESTGSPQGNWYFPIHKDGIKIIGQGDVTITSSVETVNGNWAKQDFISVWANDVVIDNVDITCKKSQNKAIEVMGQNFTLKNSTLNKVNENGSGSIIFNSENIGTAILENVKLYSWISTNYSKNGTLNATNVTIDFTDNSYAGYKDEIYGYGWCPGIFNFNATCNVTVNNTGLKLIVDDKINLTEQIFNNNLQPNTTVQLTEGTYEVDKMLNITKDDITLDLGGNTLTASSSFTYPDANNSHVLNISGDNVTVENGIVKTTTNNKHGVNVYQATGVKLRGLTIDNTDTMGGAPLIVNASNVTVEGTLSLVTGTASWYAINVDDKGTSASLKFAEESKVSYQDNSGRGLNLVQVDGNKESITVSSDSEFVDVTTDANGNIVVTPDSDGDSNSNSGSVVTPTPTDNNWRQNATGWWYQNPDGTYPANQWKYLETGKGYKAWYWFNGNGYITFGWQKVGNTWYYMNRSGEMQTGWVFVNNQWYYLSENGAMVTGWVYSGGRWYYMNNDGSMHFGWLNWAGYWYHLDSHGMMSTGWKQINGKWYYFYGENGRMAANTTTPDGYQVGADGAWIK
ncbi:MAG: hypothetical protein ACOX60_07700 [Massiliimalia sp.]|jgi:glucan-binding YG repeat protein